MASPISAEETLSEAIEQIVVDRINVHGANDSDAVQNAYSELDRAMSQLKTTVTPEQAGLLIRLENAISTVMGETMNYYYRVGFADASALLKGGNEHEN